MNRVYLPLLPLPVLAVIVAISACSKAKNEEPSIHIIPPAVAMPAPESAAAPAPKDAVAARAEDEKPTAQDVKEFETKVKK